MWTAYGIPKIGVAIYNWQTQTQFGLSLDIGDTVYIVEECVGFGWMRGFVTKNRSVKGIFPSSYVHVSPRSAQTDHVGLECATSDDDIVVRELSLVLQEWNCIWKNLYVERETYKFVTLRKVMRELLDWRRQLITSTLTQDQTRELKQRIVAKIDWGNRKLGLDLVPRCGVEIVNPQAVSIVQLHRVHASNSENTQGVQGDTIKKKESKKTLTHHLHFCMRDFGYFVGEDVQIYFSLYDAKKCRFISERFLVKISKEGFSNYIVKLHNNCTIFADLGGGDLTRDLYLVAHIYRIGKMLHLDTGTKKLLGATLSSTGSAGGNNSHFKRSHAAAVLSLSDLNVADCDEKEFSFKAFQTEDKDFHQLHEMLIRKQTSKYNPLPAQQNYGGIGVTLKILSGTLSILQEDSPVLFKNISLTRKMGFPDVIMPGDVRNDLYVTLERGEFEKGGKSTGKNIEVTVLVMDNDGQVIQDCIFGACGMDGNSEYQSAIIYHHNSPYWSETIRLSISIEKYRQAHIRFEYRHCSTSDKIDSKKLFAFSFVKLMQSEGSTLLDGLHELFVYHVDEKSLWKLHPSHYLHLASNVNECDSLVGSHNHIDSSLPLSCSLKENVMVRTLLCSTKLTQNVDLLYLLQWREHPERIHEALTRALRLNGEEMVKFLQDILDALFSMFSTEDGNSTEHSGLVFHVLVSIFNLLNNSKFEHFKPIMDAYITNHFAAALVYKGLLSSVQHCTERAMITEKQDPLRKCFISLGYIFKFVVQSRILFQQATGGQFEESFRRDLYSVFNSMNKMLSHTNSVIIHTQVALLLSISSVFDDLLRVLSAVEVTKLAISIIESLPSRDPEPQLTQAKLTMIKNMVSGKLFADSECRGLLLSTCFKHLRYHLAHRDELRICAEILSETLTFLYGLTTSDTADNICTIRGIEIICLSTLDVLIQTVQILIDRSAPVLGTLVACLLGILQLMGENEYDRLWEEIGDCKPLKDFLLRFMSVLRDLVHQDVYPPDWYAMRCAINSTILRTMRYLAQPLVFFFLESRMVFDNQLWNSFFNLAVEFLTQPSLQLEKFSVVKSSKVMEKYGDMRVAMGHQILDVWSKLGESKANFIPSMIGPFLEVTLVPATELRKATLNIFFDMMQCEQRIKGNFKRVESELIDKLDHLISENKGDDEYRKLFNTILSERVQCEDPNWRETGSAFVTSVTRLLERLLDYRSVIHGDENRDKRMSCTVNLLNFYKNEINRAEMYLRYIYKLHDLHCQADNFAEAGFALKLYADSLSWTSSAAVSHDPFASPNTPEWKRKQDLYAQIIHYFDKGKCWEKGMQLCKELAEHHEKRTFDYSELSAVLQTHARFCDNILNQIRPEPEYFRVAFYGMAFPLFVRNKIFVYRGLEYERVETFTQRIQTEFPSAQILTKSSQPPLSLMQAEEQYIQIINVKPLPESGTTCFGRPLSSVPLKIALYYRVNDVCQFQLDRPFHKEPIDKQNEFKSLWLERTTMTITDKLPGILRWFEVSSSTVEEVPPVRFACETMTQVNEELRQLAGTYESEPRRNINPLSMRLQGTVDANVMGGIAKYQDAFFTQQFVASQPEMAPYVRRLIDLIGEQMDILESSLAIHGRLAPPGVQPLHQRLVERVSQLEEEMREARWSETISKLIATPDQYCNASAVSRDQSAYSLIDDDEGIYSKPMDILEGVEEPNVMVMQKEEHRPPILPRRNSQRSLRREKSVECPYNYTCDGASDSVDAPPLPPRLNDKKITPSVPPTPPKRGSLRRDSETVSIADSVSSPLLTRDSGFSDFDFTCAPVPPPIPILSSRINISLSPPPLPPKGYAPYVEDSSVHLQNNKEVSNDESFENYAVPKFQQKDESFG